MRRVFEEFEWGRESLLRLLPREGRLACRVTEKEGTTVEAFVELELVGEVDVEWGELGRVGGGGQGEEGGESR
jgi:hypothetical protein